jgi:hypothetical protein
MCTFLITLYIAMCKGSAVYFGVWKSYTESSKSFGRFWWNPTVMLRFLYNKPK